VAGQLTTAATASVAHFDAVPGLRVLSCR